MSSANFSGDVDPAKSNAAFLKDFDPFAILQPVKMNTCTDNHNIIDEKAYCEYENDAVPTGSLMDSRREITVTDLLDNIFVTPQQIVNEKNLNESSLSSGNFSDPDIDWTARNMKRDLNDEFAKFFDKYEEKENHVKVSNLVELEDNSKSDVLTRDDTDAFGSFENKAKVLVPTLDAQLYTTQHKEFNYDIKSNNDLVNEVPEKCLIPIYFTEQIGTQGTDLRKNDEKYENTAGCSAKEYNAFEYSCNDDDDLIDEVLYEKSLEKLNLTGKLDSEKYSTKKVETQLNYVASRITNIERTQEINNITKEYIGRNSISYREVPVANPNVDNNVMLSKTINKYINKHDLQRHTSVSEDLKSKPSLCDFRNVREEEIDIITKEYVFKNSILKEDLKASPNTKMNNIKLLETIPKNKKKYAKCKHVIVKDLDKVSYTKAPGLYEKSVELPKIIERLKIRQEKLSADTNIQRRPVSDESLSILSNIGPKITSNNTHIYNICNDTGSTRSLNIGSNITAQASNEFSPVTNYPNMNTQMRNEFPELSLEILMKDCNKERLLEFKRRKLLRDYIQKGIDLA